jgi:tetratricopeptide (TPR) repeat protein
MPKPLVRVLVCLLTLLLPVVFESQTPDRRAFEKARVRQLVAEGRYAAALPLLHESLEKQRNQGDWEAYSATADDIGRCYYGRSQYDSAYIFLEKALRELDRGGQSEAPATASLLNLLAFNYRCDERWSQTLKAYQRAIAIFQKNKTLGNKPAYAYKQAAQILVRWENYTLAEQYLLAAIRTDTSGASHASVYAQLANSNHFLGDEEAVMRYFQLGMSQPKLSPDDQAHLLASGSPAFAAKGDLSVAISMLLTAKKHFSAYLKRYDDNVLRCYTALADYAEQAGQPDEAQRYFREAETFARRNYKRKTRELAKFWVEKGDFLRRCDQRDAALRCYQNALEQVYPDFDGRRLTANPTVTDSAWQVVAPESYCVTAAARKGLLLLEKIDPTPAERQLAAGCFDLALAASSVLRRTYGSENDKILRSAQNRAWQDVAASNLYALGAYSRLFEWCERSRAQALQDELRKQSGLVLAGIPDSLLAREEHLRRQAAEAGLRVSAVTTPDPRAAAQADALTARRNYEEFIQRLGHAYPQFSALVTEDGVFQLDDIQHVIPDTVALLTYFDAGDGWLRFDVRKAAYAVDFLPKNTATRSAMSRFLAALADKNAQVSDPNTLFADAERLGSALLPRRLPVALWVVPDGALCYLPFEALLTRGHRGRFGDAPWLVRSSSVRYGWAARLLTQPAAATSGSLLHVAPFAEAQRDSLAALPHSGSECPATVVSESLIDGGATAAIFLTKAPRHTVLHLATHASAGQKNAEPMIYLADRAVPMSELYGLRIPASLVCLSACETGKGRYGTGEGLLSLARAFAYAGSRSMVSSLWSVSERSTALLFAHFYEKMSAQVPQSVALREAKLALLDSDDLDARKAPFYWAGFTLTGDDGVVAIRQQPTRGWVWWLLLPLLAAGFWGWRRRTRK